MTVRAPAKINRFLYILDRLPNGYHQILTMFEKLELFDILDIQAAKDAPASISIRCPDWLPSGPENLVYKSSELFMRASGLKLAVTITIEKHIPAGGGLGGGSSDAAATLKALNELTGCPLHKIELRHLGSQLGADVPFFLEDWKIAMGRGTGTDLEEVREVLPNWYVLALPDFGVSTRWAYQNFKLTRKTDITIFDRRRLLSGDIWQNDLENPVFARYPELIGIKKSLVRAGAKVSLMSGSGSTVFGVFQDRKSAERGAAAVTAETGINCLVTSTLQEGEPAFS